MQIHYDESDEYLLKKVLDNPDIHIGLDAAIGKDRCVEVTYCIRNGCDIIKIDTISFKEAK
jgi:hypothetical protein